MKKNAKKTVVVIALIALLAIPSMFAYFTDVTDTKENVFTVGSVDINLEETGEGAVENKDAEGNPIGLKWENITAGQKIVKKPVVTVAGNNYAYVFVKVDESNKDAYTFTNFNQNLHAVDANQYPGVYYYGETAGALTALNNGRFFTVFEGLVIKDTLPEGTAAFDVDVTAYAIQKDNLTDTTPAAVWSTLQNDL